MTKRSLWSFLLLVSSFGRTPFVCNAFLCNPHSVQKKRSLIRRQASTSTTTLVDRSTLNLLNHISINIPNHDSLPFYFEILGCGVDPRKAENILAGSKTVWANCGASQFHLPFNETPQIIPGSIGLRYKSLEGIKKRVVEEASKNDETPNHFASYEIGKNVVKLVDNNGNVFYCREGAEVNTQFKQPLVSQADTVEFGDVATRWGCTDSECRGIDYIEFDCPIGTAEKIADFYDYVFDATVSVVEGSEDDSKIAIIGYGDIDSNGRASQNVLFRESTKPIPEYNGHHLALYVGESKEDFEQAFKNCMTAGVVWVNPQFSDTADTLQKARKWKQFRFKDIIDLQTGEKIFELEHAMYSVEHTKYSEIVHG